MTSFTLDWDDAFPSGTATSTRIGNVDIGISVTEPATAEPVNWSSSVSSDVLGGRADGHLRLEMDTDMSSQGVDLTMTFAGGSNGGAGVNNLSFELLDIDGGQWEDLVRIEALDVNGNALPNSAFTIVTGRAVFASNPTTLVGQFDTGAASDLANALVTISQEVASLTLSFEAGPMRPDGNSGSNVPQNIGIGPLSFDVGDGLVDGTVGADTIDSAFVDAQGDQITNGDDTIIAGGGNDTIYDSAGDDVIDAGDGDDVFVGGIGVGTSDTVDGGIGRDVYQLDDRMRAFVEVDTDGTGTLNKQLFGTLAAADLDSVSNFEAFEAGEGAAADRITITESVTVGDLSGLSDTAAGSFVDSATGDTIAFGPSEAYQLSHILAGTSPDGLLPPVGPLGSYEITSGDEDGQIGDISFSNFETIRFSTIGDGVVDGAETGEVMDAGYADTDGDRITSGDDSVFGNGGDDTIDPGDGNDTVNGGAGNDFFISSLGDDELIGGADFDTFQTVDRVRTFAAVDPDGNGTVETVWPGTSLTPIQTSTVTGIERFVASETGDPDVIAFGSAIDVKQVGTLIQGLSDDVTGTFETNILGAPPITFGPTEDYRLSHILTGTAPNDVLPAIGPRGSYSITGGDEDGQIGDVQFANFETISFTVADVADGIVDGGETGEVMGVGYTDLGGDAITNGNDTILGNGGDDTITAGDGADDVHGGAGDDTISGERGADALFGDAGNDVLFDVATEFVRDRTLDGGAGIDTLLVRDERGGSSVDFTQTAIVDIEKLTFETVFPVSSTIPGFNSSQLAQNFQTISIDAAGSSGVRFQIIMDTETLDLDSRTITSNGSRDLFQVFGTNSDETISGGSLSNAIYGRGGNDTIVSGAAGDNLLGETGNDLLVGDDQSADNLSGGADIDTLSYASVITDIFVNLATNQVIGTGGDTISGFENFIGGSGNDLIRGSGGANELRGGNGNDIIAGSLGADSLFGGDGRDRFEMSIEHSATKLIDGGSGPGLDSVVFALENGITVADLSGITFKDLSTLAIGVGAPTGSDPMRVIFASDQFTTFRSVFTDTGPRDLTVEVGLGDSTTFDLAGKTFTNSTNDARFEIYGDADDERIIGTPVLDLIDAGAGNDTLVGVDGGDTLRGGDDADLFSAFEAGSLFDSTIDGGSGGTDNDTIDLRGLGDYRIINETIDSDGNSTSGTVEFLDASGGVMGSFTYTEIENFAGRIAPVAGDDTLRLDEDDAGAVDVLANDSDADGDDLVVSGYTGASNGSLSLVGGVFTYTPDANFNGRDTFTYTVSDGTGRSDTASVYIKVDPVNDAPELTGPPTTLAGGTGGEAYLVRTSDLLQGFTDVDGDQISATNLAASAGSVTDNGDGSYTVNTSAGFSGDLILAYNVTDGISVVPASLTAAFGSSVNVIDGTTRNDRLWGTREDDVINGYGKNDRIFGRDGYDTLNGGSGNDRMFGGKGNDLLDGGSGNDRIWGGFGQDTIIGGAGNDRMFGGHGDDMANGDTGSDRIFGGKGNDLLDGGSGNDRIWGGFGQDTIIGGAGNDRLHGGRDSDVFVFDLNSGRDVISDFDGNPNGGQDLLDISALGITESNFASRVEVRDTGSSVLLVFDGTPQNSVRLLGVQDSGSITIDDFVFV